MQARCAPAGGALPRARAWAYHRPTTLAEAFRLKAEEPAARFIAGGTDLMVRLREGRERPPALISLRGIAELAGIQDGGGLTIGALTPVADVAAHPAVAEVAAALAKAARVLGSVQIRNAATVGGNLCNASPCADLAPPLLVLEATVRVAGPGGATRELPLEDFFVAPGSTRLAADEIVTAVVIQRPAAGTRTTFWKKGRVAMDLSLASVAARLELDGGGRCVRVRLAAGAVAPRPLRLRGAEAALEGKALGDDVLAAARAAASEEVSPITDLRATADWRRRVTGVLVERAVRELAS